MRISWVFNLLWGWVWQILKVSTNYFNLSKFHIWAGLHVKRCLSLKRTTNEPQHDKTNKMSVRPANTQISLGICPVWSESSVCAQWVPKDPGFLHADSEDSDQTGRMPRLIWVFAGRTCHFVGFDMRWLKCAGFSAVMPESLPVPQTTNRSSGSS